MQYHAKSLDDIAEHFEVYAETCSAKRGQNPPTATRVGPVTQALLEDARLLGEASAWMAAAQIVRQTVMKGGASD